MFFVNALNKAGKRLECQVWEDRDWQLLKSTIRPKRCRRLSAVYPARRVHNISACFAFTVCFDLFQDCRINFVKNKCPSLKESAVINTKNTTYQSYKVQ